MKISHTDTGHANTLYTLKTVTVWTYLHTSHTAHTYVFRVRVKSDNLILVCVCSSAVYCLQCLHFMYMHPNSLNIIYDNV